MKRFIEKWYILFMLMRIARHNKIRQKFEEKYNDVFDSYEEGFEYMVFSRCHEENKRLYKRREDGTGYVVANEPQRDCFGLYEYVDQRCGYIEDDFYGTIYTKTPFRNIWLERKYHC